MKLVTRPNVVAGLTALLFSLPLVAGQNSSEITVYGSVVYARTGEHTPQFPLASEMDKLTPFGAQQMANMVLYSMNYTQNKTQANMTRDRSFALGTWQMGFSL
jgi:hypothetical protein